MANENPYRNVISPRRLVMVRDECFYCGNNEDVKHTCVEYLLGIKHCQSHSYQAIRDCKAYLHENKLVDMNDIKNEPVFKNFINVFKDKKFHIIRSNGNVDDGWSLKEDAFHDKAFIMNKDGYWYLPLCKYTDKDIITKGFKITDFDNSKLVELNKDIYPSNFVELQRDIIHFLEKGIYKKYYELQKKEMCEENDKEYPDENFIKKIDFQGRQVRVAIFEKQLF